MRSSLALPYLCSLLPQRASATAGYSFRKSGYPVPATRKSSTLSSFVPRSIVLWNALPKEIQESNTLTKLKSQLRTHLHIWYVNIIAFLNSKWSPSCLYSLILFNLLTFLLRLPLFHSYVVQVSPQESSLDVLAMKWIEEEVWRPYISFIL